MKAIPFFIIFFYFAPFVSLYASEGCNIVYGIHDKYKPYEWIDDKGRADGLNIDILDAAAKIMGCSYKIVRLPWKDTINALRDNKITMVSSSMTEERERYLVQLPHTTVLYRYFFTLKTHPPINSISDLSGKRIAVIDGGIAEEFIHKSSEEYNIEIVKVKTHYEAIELLLVGNVSAVVSSLVAMLNIMENEPSYNSVSITNLPILPSIFGFLIHKDNMELYNKMNAALNVLKANGGYFEILKKWSETKNHQWLRYALISSICFISVIFVILIWNKSLHMIVMRKTKKLNEEIDSRIDAQSKLISANTNYMLLNSLFRTVLDSMPEDIYLIDHDANIAWSNRAEAQSSDKRFDINLLEKHIYRAIKDDTPFEISELTDRGASWKITGIRITHSNYCLLVVALNITENVRLRNESFMSARLAALGEMAAIVSHEINNPAAIILYNHDFLKKIFTQLIERVELYSSPQEYFLGYCWDEAKKEISCSVAAIDESVKRIMASTLELKEFGCSRDNGYQIVRLDECLASALKFIAFFTKRYTKKLTVETEPSLPPIYGNKLHIEQIIINLVQNACYALTDISQGVTCRLSDVSGMVRLTISDEGCGMDSETTNKACEPFFTTRKNSGGTGLGLSIVSRIVSDHKGTIDIKSVRGFGTSVSVTFPAYCGGGE